MRKDTGRLNGRCSQCLCEYYRSYRQSNKVTVAATKRKYNQERGRGPNLKAKYGLSVDEYSVLASGGCEVCGTYDDLNVDHDHKCCPGKKSCGKCVRGVLCNRHNTGIAKFDDDIDLLRMAIFYLSKQRLT